jgi:hypothetical protein
MELERLWAFAVSAYFDNPIPSLFKERLFVYLSRFCEVRYCIIRHCAFLLGYGHSAGDPTVDVQSVEQVLRLLSRSTPWERGRDNVAEALKASPPYADWPETESELEDKLFSAATHSNGLRALLTYGESGTISAFSSWYAAI